MTPAKTRCCRSAYAVFLKLRQRRSRPATCRRSRGSPSCLGCQLRAPEVTTPLPARTAATRRLLPRAADRCQAPLAAARGGPTSPGRARDRLPLWSSNPSTCVPGMYVHAACGQFSALHRVRRSSRLPGQQRAASGLRPRSCSGCSGRVSVRAVSLPRGAVRSRRDRQNGGAATFVNQAHVPRR